MTTIFKFSSAICLVTLLACNNHGDTNKIMPSKKAEKIVCNPYYQFDKIDHYFQNIEEEKLWKIDEKKTKTKKEKKLLDLLIENIPEKLSDTAILNDIEILGFVKKEIQVDKFKQINEIFCQRKHNEIYAMTCIAVYRDILVFKKGNKIIGTAKLCLSCDQNVITGTTLNTETFGQSGDYNKLFQILHKQ